MIDSMILDQILSLALFVLAHVRKQSVAYRVQMLVLMNPGLPIDLTIDKTLGAVSLTYLSIRKEGLC